jgi:Undecaprenyl-phosphate glucose phosphotransferase
MTDLVSGTQKVNRRPILLSTFVRVVRLIDVAIIGIFGLLSFFVLRDRMGDQAFQFYLNVIILGTTFSALIFEWVGAYDVDAWRSLFVSFKRVFFGWCASTAALLAFGFAFQIPEVAYSRLWGTTWFLTTGSALLISRVIAYDRMRSMRSSGKFNARVVIYGAGAQGQRLAEFITKSKHVTIQIIGFIDDRIDGRVPSQVSGLPVLGGMKKLERMIRDEVVDQVFLALPWSAEKRVVDIVSRVAMTPVRVRLAPDIVGYRFTHRNFRLLDGLPILDLFERPISGSAQIVKLIEDRFLALVAAIVLSPLLCLIALAIKFDSRGPILYRQNRVGFNQRTIRIWKFRSMYHDKCDNGDIVQARPGDPRVTRVGRILRRWSLDELPQFLNVLTGEMSIVGPRPHAPSTKVANRPFDEIVDTYAARHNVKPGITGWAQINGWRGETNTEEKLVKRVEHDLYYIERWSVGFDLYIILRTATTIFTDANAY